MAEEKCCELIDGEPWDRKTVVWKNKPYVKDHYLALFYMPIGIGGVLKKRMEQLEQKDLTVKEPPQMLWRNEGMFGGDVYTALKKDDPSLKIEKISGKFFTMFFEDKNYSDAPKWHKAFKDEAEKRKLDIKEIMVYYSVCPGCLKKFGKVQAVLFGRL